MIIPRAYQNNCVNAGFSYYENGGVGNQVWALPTGTGKSVIPPLFMQRALNNWPDQRFIVLTHVKELIQQNYKALLSVWPTAPASIFSAGLGKKEGFAPIVIGGIASVVNATDQIGRRDILFIDECHLLSPKDDSMYQQTIAKLKVFNPYLKIIGLTATAFRMGQGRLTDPVFKDGKESPSLFTDMTFDLTGIDAFNKLIDDCYLSPLVPKSTENIIDVSDVRQLANDFNQSELIQTIDSQNITGRALAEAYELCRDRKSWIVFGAGIKNCLQIRDILNGMGVATTAVHSNTKEFAMSSEERNNAISAFKAGRFRAIVSNNILTTGFDHSAVDAIIDLRPTTSIPLHIQKYGRGTRPYFAPWYTFEQLQHLEHRKAAIQAGGKLNCLVLDFAGNTPRLGPINDPRIPSRKKGDGTGDAPIKLCPECGAYHHTTVRLCTECNHEFVFKTKLKASASTADIIVRNELNIKHLPVTQWFPHIHKKKGKPDSLKIVYCSNLQSVNVWLSFESTGLAKHKAHEWWRQHQGDDLPKTTKEAYNRFNECRRTNSIKVDFGGKWPQILEFLF